MIKIFLSFLLIGLLNSSYAKTTQSLTSSALNFFKKGNFVESKKDWVAIIKQDPKNGLAWFNLGHTFYKLNDLQKAVKCYQRVEALNSPLAPAARYYQAQILSKLNKPSAAKVKLAELLTSSNLPPNIKKLALKLQAELVPQNREEKALEAYQSGNFTKAREILKGIPEKSLSEHGKVLLMLTLTRLNQRNEFNRLKRSFFKDPRISKENKQIIRELEREFPESPSQRRALNLSLDVSAGRNSNVYADGNSVEALKAAEYRAFIAAGYLWLLSGFNNLRTTYSFFGNTFSTAPELNAYTHSLRTSYFFSDNKFTLEIGPYFQLQNWAGTFVSNRIGSSMLLSRTFTSSEIGFLADYSKRNSTEDEFSYLEGSLASTRLYISHWAQKWYFEVFASIGKDDTQDIVYSDGGRLPLSHNFYGPGGRFIYRMHESLHFSGQGSYLFRDYDSKAIPGPQARNDQEASMALRLTYYFAPGLSAYLLYENLDNQSTLGPQDVRDKNYRVQTQFIGLAWDYL